MRKILVPITFLFFISAVFVSCYYDNEEALYPRLTGPCDTLNVTFTSKIKPLLSNNCWSCHSNANAQFGGGRKLEILADVRSISGLILPAINQTGPFPMPLNGKLSQCSIDQFTIWIRNGMPE